MPATRELAITWTQRKEYQRKLFQLLAISNVWRMNCTLDALYQQEQNSSRLRKLSAQVKKVLGEQQDSVLLQYLNRITAKDLDRLASSTITAYNEAKHSPARIMSDFFSAVGVFFKSALAWSLTALTVGTITGVGGFLSVMLGISGVTAGGAMIFFGPALALLVFAAIVWGAVATAIAMGKWSLKYSNRLGENKVGSKEARQPRRVSLWAKQALRNKNEHLPGKGLNQHSLFAEVQKNVSTQESHVAVLAFGVYRIEVNKLGQQ